MVFALLSLLPPSSSSPPSPITSLTHHLPHPSPPSPITSLTHHTYSSLSQQPSHHFLHPPHTITPPPQPAVKFFPAPESTTALHPASVERCSKHSRISLSNQRSMECYKGNSHVYKVSLSPAIGHVVWTNTILNHHPTHPTPPHPTLPPSRVGKKYHN